MPDACGLITAIYIYPIKSCAGLSLDSSVLTTTGLAHDRQWMIVDQSGQFQTQRQIPHLAWIEPEVEESTLRLRAPGLESISIPFASRNSHQQNVIIWRDSLVALDMGDTAAQWLDNYLEVPGKRFRLVQFDDRQSRLSDPHWTKGFLAHQAFTDGFAVNVVSQASLDTFNERLAERSLDPIDVTRWRPNLVIDGLAAHEEDELQTVSIQDGQSAIEFGLVKPCPRCQIPTINPVTATFEPEISDVLSRYRQMANMDGALCFGMNGFLKAGIGQSIHVGNRYSAQFGF